MVVAMSGAEWAGIIAAVAAAVTGIGAMLGKAVRWLYTELTGEMKATIEAKNKEIGALSDRLAQKDAELRAVMERHR